MSVCLASAPARVRRCGVLPRALDGAELVTLGEAEWLELRLEVEGLGCNHDDIINNNNKIIISNNSLDAMGAIPDKRCFEIVFIIHALCCFASMAKQER